MRRELPGERVVYMADGGNLPYGSKTLDEVRGFSEALTRRFLTLPVKMVVVACNTASAAALKYLRGVFPQTPFVGMEPAVKPAAANSRTRRVGVLATRATFQGELFESVVERFAGDVEVVRQPCPGLAEFIEHHAIDDPGLEAMLAEWVPPLVERGVDTLVLACTHYAFARDTIERLAGPGVRVIDPANAIARRVRQVLAERDELARGEGGEEFFATGDARRFAAAASRLLGRNVPVGAVG